MNHDDEELRMKVKTRKAAKAVTPALARVRAVRPQTPVARGQDLGDRRLQLLLGIKSGTR